MAQVQKVRFFQKRIENSQLALEVTETMISELLKFNSGAKNFQLVDGKTLSPSIDGFRLNPNCWLSKRPRTVPSKLH